MVKWLGIIGRTLWSALRTHQALLFENLALRQTAGDIKASPGSATTDRHGPLVLGGAVANLVSVAGVLAYRPAWYGCPLASAGFPVLLALEESLSRASTD